MWCWLKILGERFVKKDNEKTPSESSLAIVGFVAGFVTVLLVLFACEGPLKTEAPRFYLTQNQERFGWRR
jgi:hypothetical protein